MKKIITTVAIVFCMLSSDAQPSKVNYIQKDTIEILYYDSLGNEFRYNPPRIVIKRTEVGDPEYWKRKHRRHQMWNKISFGLWAVGTAIMLIITL
jgi:hypothetical protein